MNLNRQFFIMLLMILSTIACGKENLPMMTVSLEKGSISAIIYQGAPQKDILASLKKAHQISEKQAEKSVVMEGIYHIMIQNQSAIQIFSVQNNYWIYDEVNKRLLRCKLLNPLRDMLFLYLYEKKDFSFFTN